jgi:hypothetical protein
MIWDFEFRISNFPPHLPFSGGWAAISKFEISNSKYEKYVDGNLIKEEQ